MMRDPAAAPSPPAPSRRAWLVALAAPPVIALAATLAFSPAPLVVWNATPSVPTGLYRIARDDSLQPGDLVAAFAPARFRSLAAERGYLPERVPLVKRIAASAGDRVCAKRGWVTVNGRRVARRQRADALGRRLPWWEGCRRLGAGDYLLLGDHARSFDGRYFGPVARPSIVGKATPLWRA